MEPALVLTEEKAQTLGYAGQGPFTLGGAFPGEYLLDQPVAIQYLGFDGEEEARAAFDAAFANIEEEFVPLEWVDVEEGEGLPIRINHALSEAEAAPVIVERVVEEKAGGKITTHAEADAVAEELGISWPEAQRLTVADKVEAITSFRAAGDQDAMTPAPGAEDTVPVPDDDSAVEA